MSGDEYRDLKLRKRILVKLRDVFAEMQGSREECAVAAHRALKYALPVASVKTWLKKISKLRGSRERCPSGILLNVPLAVPLRVLSWFSLKRLYEVYDADYDAYYYFVCLDDVGKAAQLGETTVASNVWLKGVATRQQLEDMISGFALVLARLVKTNRRVRFSKRLQLAIELEKAVWSVLGKWAEEEGGGVAEK